MPELTVHQWLFAVLAGLGIGVSKSGLSGASLLHVVVFASIFGGRESTGVVLPMLIVGDLMAVVAFRQHARWDYIRRLLPPALVGVALGWAMMTQIDDRAFKPLVGWIIVALTTLQLVRMWKPDLYDKAPHRLWFAWMMGFTGGVTTMLANAAGPIMALYFIAVSLPKYELIGTGAWFFLVVNCLKVPFSFKLGLIHPGTLLLNTMLVPAIAAGFFGGRWVVPRIPQKFFDALLLAFAAIAALRLIGFF